PDRIARWGRMGNRQDDDEARVGAGVARRNKTSGTILAVITARCGLSIPQIVISDDQARLRLGERHDTVFTSSIRRDEPIPGPSRHAPLLRPRSRRYLPFDRFGALPL